jgi:hypothetical protein
MRMLSVSYLPVDGSSLVDSGAGGGGLGSSHKHQCSTAVSNNNSLRALKLIAIRFDCLLCRTTGLLGTDMHQQGLQPVYGHL